jgi:hypothetical protein
VEKGIKEEEDEFIPLKSRFWASLCHIAYFIVSLSFATEPSSAAI